MKLPGGWHFLQKGVGPKYTGGHKFLERKILKGGHKIVQKDWFQYNFSLCRGNLRCIVMGGHNIDVAEIGGSQF